MIKNFKRVFAALLVALLLVTQMPAVFAQTSQFHITSDAIENPLYYNLPQSDEAPISSDADLPESEKYVTDNAAAADFIRTQLKNRKPQFLLHFEVPKKASNDELNQIIWDLLDLAIGETDKADEGDYLRFCYKEKAFDAEGGYIGNKTQLDITYKMGYFTTFEQEQELTAKIKEVIDGFGFTAQTTEYKKARTIHDYISDNITYDYENLEDKTYLLKFSAYAALIHKTAVCEGYATLYYRMLKEAGMDARVITGFGGKNVPQAPVGEKDANHAWNIVKVGKMYYYVDTTWDAERHDCEFFLKGEKDFPEHKKMIYYDMPDFKKAYRVSENAIPCEYGTQWVKVSKKQHALVCKNCGTFGKKYNHKPNNAGICTDCGYDTGNRPVVTPPKPAKPTNPFTDVKKSDYYYDSVLWAVENNVTAGLSKNNFGPGAYCTRGQVVTFLWRAAGQPKVKNKNNPFTDVGSNQFYYTAVLWAVEKGITSGITKTSFAPNATCSRGQIVAFLYRFAGSPKVSVKNPFGDVSSKQYYYKPVLWAVKNGITSGISPTSFAPNATCTRAQVVSFLYRHIK